MLIPIYLEKLKYNSCASTSTGISTVCTYCMGQLSLQISIFRKCDFENAKEYLHILKRRVFVFIKIGGLVFCLFLFEWRKYDVIQVQYYELRRVGNESSLCHLLNQNSFSKRENFCLKNLRSFQFELFAIRNK